MKSILGFFLLAVSPLFAHATSAPRTFSCVTHDGEMANVEWRHQVVLTGDSARVTEIYPTGPWRSTTTIQPLRYGRIFLPGRAHLQVKAFLNLSTNPIGTELYIDNRRADRAYDSFTCRETTQASLRAPFPLRYFECDSNDGLQSTAQWRHHVVLNGRFASVRTEYYAGASGVETTTQPLVNGRIELPGPYGYIRAFLNVMTAPVSTEMYMHGRPGGYEYFECWEIGPPTVSK